MNVCLKYSKLQLPVDLESRLDSRFDEAINRGVFPGASLLICQGPSKFQKTWGSVESAGIAVNSSTRFDLASLTKSLVTAPLCMAAIQKGILALDDPLSRVFPGVVPEDKEKITVRHLLSHSSGLPPYEPFYLKLIELPQEERRNELLSMLLKTPLDAAPGTAANYSDLGYMLLGLILEGLMGERLDSCAQNFLFDRLGIDELQFCPIDKAELEEEPKWDLHAGGANRRDPGSRYAATQLCPWRKRILLGEVDDENAWCLNGVAGHAGLFGTAAGVFSMVSFLWNIYDGKISDPLWPRELVRLFWTRSMLDGVPSDWCLGYDTPSRKGGSTSGRHFSSNTIGHLGFTGVSFWLDLKRGILVILLSNRVHPTRQNDEIRPLRPILHDIIMEALIYGK